MTYAGADGATKAEMAATLRYPSGKDIHDSLPKLSRALLEIAEETTTQAEQMKKWKASAEPVVFTVANRHFGQHSYPFLGEFLRQLQDTYDAPLERMDFAHSDAATRHIKEWVEKQTRDRIKNLIPSGLLNATTRLVLVNAVYLKAPRAVPFNEVATEPEPFHAADGRSKPQPSHSG